MIEGFINLSLPLKRLGFMKVIVFLTNSSSSMYTSQLITRYKETVRQYRKEFEWNKDPDTGLSVPGSGIGKPDIPPNDDNIAVDHVLLAQSLGFIRREVNIWRRYGWHLASQYLDGRGKPLFLDLPKREEMLKSKGLIAKLPRSEQFIFFNALLYSDIDGIIPLLECLDNRTTSELREQYFDAVSRWYDRKSRLEPNPTRRYFYSGEKARFAKKENEGGYSKIHRESQIYPRLHFLTDVGVIAKNASNYELSELGKDFKKQWLSLDDKEVYKMLDEKEITLGILLADCYNNGLGEVTSEEFEHMFYRISVFYKYIGLIMIPYEDLYFSMVAFALNVSKSLSFPKYKVMLEKLARARNYDLSTNMPGRRYIRT